MVSNLKILITTGDPDGIGREVAVKALNAVGRWTRFAAAISAAAGQRVTAGLMNAFEKTSMIG